MLMSRRSTLAYASALTATAAAPTAALARAITPAGRSQLIQHLVVHPDEARVVCAHLSLEAPDTAWKTSGDLDEGALHDTTASLRSRGYGLRRVNAFQTSNGVRYAALWQLGRPAPAQVKTGMDLATFRAATAEMAQQGYDISQLDAACTDAGTRFAAIWDGSATNQKVLTNLTEAELANAAAADGFVPYLIAGYASDGSARFAAVFGSAKATDMQAETALPASEAWARMRAMRTAGYHLRDASGYVVGGEPYITAVWERA